MFPRNGRISVRAFPNFMSRRRHDIPNTQAAKPPCDDTFVDGWRQALGENATAIVLGKEPSILISEKEQRADETAVVILYPYVT
jgi:hypothetical protein